VEEVKRVCAGLGIRDWTSMTEATVLLDEAETILAVVGCPAVPVSAGTFRAGLEVELGSTGRVSRTPT